MMRLLFVQGGVHVFYDEDRNAYVDSNGDRAIWERYRRYCDELRLILRNDGKIHPKSELLSKAAKFDESLAEIVPVPNVYVPRSNYFKPSLHLREMRIIAEEVRRLFECGVSSCGGRVSGAFEGSCGETWRVRAREIRGSCSAF